MNLRSTDRTCVSGLPGTGKTTLVRYLATLAEPNLLIYDPLGQYLNEFPKECVYVPQSNSQQEFDNVCKRLCARSNVVFIVEECERYIGQGRELGPYAFDLVNRGRNWGIGIIAVTRRIQRISKDFFDLCQNVVFFKCGLKSREYISDLIGKEHLGTIMSLERFHFMYYNLETEESTIAHLQLGGTSRIKEQGKPAQPTSDLIKKPKSQIITSGG